MEYLSLLLLLCFLATFGLSRDLNNTSDVGENNILGRSLVVFAAPSIHSLHYRSHFKDLIHFLATFTKHVLPNDNVVILADNSTMPYLKNLLPNDLLLSANISDIWLRDFAPVRASRPVRFRYRPLYITPYISGNISASLDSFLASYRLTIRHYSSMVLDGGNVVDNGHDKAVVTDRVIYDNHNEYTDFQIDLMLTDALGYSQVATVSELQGDLLGHTGDMLSFIDTNVIAVGALPSAMEERTRRQLRQTFGDSVLIVVIPNHYRSRKPLWHGLPSSCGLYVNSIMTPKALYVPLYGKHSLDRELNVSTDAAALNKIRKFTARNVIAIDVPWSVCSIGSSLRRLSWQLQGVLADQLVNLARKLD